MDREKSQTSNHSMVSLVLFHRFTLVACVISWFIQSRMFLLMMPISVLHGLMSLQFRLFLKSGLRSFSVTYIHTYINFTYVSRIFT